MVKYLQDLISAFKSRLVGMNANAEKWQNQQVTIANIQNYVVELEAQSAKIDAAEAALQQEREIGRKLADSYVLKLKQVDNLAYGIHSEESEKLSGYGLALRRSNTTRPIPGKCMITSIVDDIDGEGFVITWDTLPDATHYEIEKGVAANITDMVLAPSYPFLKSTSKTTLTDDDVIKGRRYFYRVRGVNPSGPGEWSESVNKVQ